MTTLLVALLLPFPLCRGSPELQAKAKVTCLAARKSALSEVGGKGLRVRSSELEEEGGKLVDSFDVKRKGKPGVDEVQVDALTGEVSSVKHESAKDEAKEKD